MAAISLENWRQRQLVSGNQLEHRNNSRQRRRRYWAEPSGSPLRNLACIVRQYVAARTFDDKMRARPSNTTRFLLNLLYSMLG
jgi:hypothetical protein